MLECTGYGVRYAYAYLGTPIHECLDVHIVIGNSHPNMDEHRLLHDHFMPDMYKDEYLKRTKFWI